MNTLDNAEIGDTDPAIQRGAKAIGAPSIQHADAAPGAEAGSEPTDEPELPLGEWIKTPEALAALEKEIQRRLQPDYVPTPLERAIQEAGREFAELQHMHEIADPILRPYLAETGWLVFGRFLSRDLGVLADHVRCGDLESANSMMVGFARGEVDLIEADVAAHWPKRVPILAQAFAAHRAGQYALSIPVLLAQADGIAYEVLGLSLYSKRGKRGVPAVRDAYRARLENHIDPERSPWALMFGPLELVCSWRENTRIWDPRRSTDPHYGHLNRHAVLHGHDLDYPTEENSLRAVLLLGYVSELRWWLEGGENASDSPEDKQGAKV